MAVGFDAVGPSSAGKTSTTSPSSWTHTAAGSNVAILAGFGYGHASGADGTVSVTCDGNAMSQVAQVKNNNTTAGGTWLYGIAAQASGAHTIVITITGGAASLTLESGSLSYTGAGNTFATAFGTPVTAFGDSSVSGTQTVTVSGTTAGNMVAGLGSIGTGNITNPATSRWAANFSNSNGAGNAGMADKAAGGSVSFTWTDTGGGDFWGAIGVEILAAVAAGSVFPWDPPRYPQRVIIPMMMSPRRRQNGDLVPPTLRTPEGIPGLIKHSPVPLLRKHSVINTESPPPVVQAPFVWDAQRYPEKGIVRSVRRGAAATGWLVPVQPPEIPHSLRRPSRPLLPRKSFIGYVTPRNPIVPPGSERASFKPPWPRRGTVPGSGLPVPVQPPETSWRMRRWVRPLLPRRGVTQLTGLPVPIQPPTIPDSVRNPIQLRIVRRGRTIFVGTQLPANPPISYSERRQSRPPWPRKGNVPPTGWPVSVQPPTPSTRMRRGSRPLLPRRGVSRGTVPPPVITNPPISWFERRYLRPPLPRRGVVPPTGWPVPIQPPERMQSVRRYIRPLLTRKGVVRNATSQTIATPIPYIPETSRYRIRVTRRTGYSVLPPGKIPVPVPPVERQGRFSKIMRFSRVAPVPPVQPLPQVSLNPRALRLTQKLKQFRRGHSVPGTGLPVPVQPPARFNFLRRRIRPLLPRRGVVPSTALPFVAPPVPIIIKLPVWVWIENVIPIADVVSDLLPYTYVVINLPAVDISISLPTVNIQISIPLEQEEED